MTLSELLAASGVGTALIVDDVCDQIPTANDIGRDNRAWPIFSDDLQDSHREEIIEKYPGAVGRRFDDLITDDDYVAAIWELREELGDICEPVFQTYISDQEADQRYINLAVEQLEGLGMACSTVGRDFCDEAQSVDLILIDLFFHKSQNDEALDESKAKLKQALSSRRENLPIVILMSRSTRLEAKREEFRDDVGLLDSAFRVINKAELDNPARLSRLLERLAQNSEDSRKLGTFLVELEKGMESATDRTLRLLRKLRLSDISQIQQLLLSAEGEPTGSYLVDVFDRVLQHEIERESGIIDAALNLNEFSILSHPPPYVAGSPELQELVGRILAQNSERLRLAGSISAQVTFGDILRLTPEADAGRLKSELLVDADQQKVMLVLTPACDLQRGGAARILLLVGTLNSLAAHTWKYGDDVRTPAINIEDEYYWIKWNLKHIDTVSHEQLERVFQNGDLKVVARLREAHVLELQQKLLSELGRVGMIAALPATFSVDIEVYYPNIDGVPTMLDVPVLSEGAVCFVGRDDNRSPLLRLVMTDLCCDAVTDAIAAIEEKNIAKDARIAFGHLCASTDLINILTNGISLKGVRDNGWTHLESQTGQANGVPKMGLLAWNYKIPEEALHKKDLTKAGIILLVKDREGGGAPGYEAIVQSGLVQPDVAEE